MSGINRVRNLQIFYFSNKNKEIKKTKKKTKKKCPSLGIYTYYLRQRLKPC